MKKLMMAAVALICMTMMSVSLTACGGDDDSHGTVYSLVLCKIIVISSKK